MPAHRIVATLSIAGLACAASAQPALDIRMPNGLNYMIFPPGAAVPLRVWAHGLPPVGTPMAWTTPPGNGQLGTYQGFVGVRLNVHSSSGTWLPPTIFPPFLGPPVGNPGTPNASGVSGINITVGPNPRVAASPVLLWTGTITLGSSNVNLGTQVLPIGSPPQAGFEVALDVGLGHLVSHTLPALNGTAVFGTGGPAPCYADCNRDFDLNLADFGCFQTKFALGSPYADCNGDGALNLADFGCFQTKFALAQQCP